MKSLGSEEEAARSSIGLGMLREVPNTKVTKIENVTYTKFMPGTVAFGYILQLNAESAVVSLPGGVTGTVALNEVSDVCHTLVGPTKKEVNTICHRPISFGLMYVLFLCSFSFRVSCL